MTDPYTKVCSESFFRSFIDNQLSLASLLDKVDWDYYLPYTFMAVLDSVNLKENKFAIRPAESQLSTRMLSKNLEYAFNNRRKESLTRDDLLVNQDYIIKRDEGDFYRARLLSSRDTVMGFLCELRCLDTGVISEVSLENMVDASCTYFQFPDNNKYALWQEIFLPVDFAKSYPCFAEENVGKLIDITLLTSFEPYYGTFELCDEFDEKTNLFKMAKSLFVDEYPIWRSMLLDEERAPEKNAFYPYLTRELSSKLDNCIVMGVDQNECALVRDHLCTKALDILRDVLVTYGDKEMEALRVKELKDLRVGQAYIVFDENRREFVRAQLMHMGVHLSFVNVDAPGRPMIEFKSYGFGDCDPCEFIFYPFKGLLFPRLYFSIPLAPDHLKDFKEANGKMHFHPILAEFDNGGYFYNITHVIPRSNALI